MVACHFEDLEGAKAVGMKTAYIHREGEADSRDASAEAYIDYHISAIGDLAKQT